MSTGHRSTKSRAAKAPWDEPNPKTKARKRGKPLSPAAKSSAKKAAKRAGRPYPNLVDNMHAAAQDKAGKGRKLPKKRKSSSKRAAASGGRKKTARKKRAPARSRAASTPATRAKATRDPRGGLTAAGRAEFRRRDGSRLKPGVRKRISEMSPEEMKRKGSWAVRFYGRSVLPALVDDNGRPTRFALSAHAWGEPVPRTEAQARRIADKGHRLIERYKRIVERGRRPSAR